MRRRPHLTGHELAACHAELTTIADHYAAPVSPVVRSRTRLARRLRSPR